jgi:CheY-like chemotaxis protein
MDKGADVPIVALSASVFESEGTSVLESGANDFLRKPFREEQIWEVLERLLGLEFSRESVQEVEVVKQEVKLTVEAVTVLGPQLIGGMRAATAALDFEVLQELFDEVAITDPGFVRSLRQLLRECDYEALSALFALDDRES